MKKFMKTRYNKDDKKKTMVFTVETYEIGDEAAKNKHEGWIS